VVLGWQVAFLAGEPEVRDRDREPVARERAGRRRADAVVAPGDEGDAAIRQP
jgi:hypothetical protein